MEELLTNTWEELIGRRTGPLHFRFILQPIVAAVFAIRAGRKDARQGRPPFLTAFVREPIKRWRLVLLDSSKDIGSTFLVGVGIDIIYQLLVLYGIRPLESLIVPTVLAVVPYLVVRGLTNRIVTWWRGEGQKHE